MHAGRVFSSRLSTRLTVQLTLFTAILLLGALSLLSWQSLRLIEQQIEGTLYKEAMSMGAVLADDLGYALSLGIPLQALPGVQTHLQRQMRYSDMIDTIQVFDAQHQLVYAVGTPEVLLPAWPSARQRLRTNESLVVAVPVVGGQVTAGILIGVPLERMQQRLLDSLADVLTVMGVVLVIVFELLSITMALRIQRPLQVLEQAFALVGRGDFRLRLLSSGHDPLGRLQSEVSQALQRVALRYEHLRELAEDTRTAQIDARRITAVDQVMQRLNQVYALCAGDQRRILQHTSVAAVRLPLLLLVFAEELSRAFWPLYVDQLYVETTTWLMSREMAIALPLAAFMLALALTSLPIAGSVHRLGDRRLFLFGASCCALSFIGTAWATGLWSLVGWRMLSGVGFACGLVACQRCMLHRADPDRRTHTMATFVATVMIAALCGTALGAVIADRFGYRTTFFLATAVALAAALAFYVLVTRSTETTAEASSSSTWPRRAPASVVVGFAMRMMLTGFLFYLVPLGLASAQLDAAQTGRAMLLYFMPIILLGPWFAHWADRTHRTDSCVVIGSILAGCGPLLLLLGQEAWLMYVALAVLGVGHAISAAPTLLLGYQPSSLLRLSRAERFAGLLGPLLAALLASQLSYRDAAPAFGVLMLCAVLPYAVTRWREHH